MKKSCWPSFVIWGARACLCFYYGNLLLGGCFSHRESGVWRAAGFVYGFLNRSHEDNATKFPVADSLTVISAWTAARLNFLLYSNADRLGLVLPRVWRFHYCQPDLGGGSR